MKNKEIQKQREIREEIRLRLSKLANEEVELSSLEGKSIIVLNDAGSAIDKGVIFKRPISDSYELTHRANEEAILVWVMTPEMSLRHILDNIYLLSTPQGVGGGQYFNGGMSKLGYNFRDKILKQVGL